MYNCKNEGTLTLFQNDASNNLKHFLVRFEYFWIKIVESLIDYEKISVFY